jgi:hypothetical protein
MQVSYQHIVRDKEIRIGVRDGISLAVKFVRISIVIGKFCHFQRVCNLPALDNVSNAELI